jgi:hypothetical protein
VASATIGSGAVSGVVERVALKRMNRNLLVTMTVVAMTILTHGQGQQGGRGGAPGGGRAGGPTLPPLMQTAPKPAIPNVKAPDTLPATRRDQSGVVTR